MKIYKLLLVIVLSFFIITPIKVYSQTFTEEDSSFVNVEDSHSEWGDYDNDGDLDMLITGRIVSKADRVTIIYQNTDTGFVEQDFNLTGVDNAVIAWSDFNNDGYLDFLYSYNTIIGSEQTILFSYTPQGTFDSLDLGIGGVYHGYIDCGDFDNDGDVDFIMMGTVQYPTNEITRIYRNEGSNVFVDIGAGLTGLSSGAVNWGDYDNDGDLDIVQTGIHSSINTKTVIYKNLGNDQFEEVNSNFINLYTGDVKWGDYDQDGDLDFAVNGVDSFFTAFYTLIYKNEGQDNFVELGGNLPGPTEGSSLSWGDCDNDGDLDLAYTTSFDGDVIYINDDTVFTQLNTFHFTHSCCGSLNFCDYDNDMDLDVLISGFGEGTKLFRNESLTPNTNPDPPTVLTSLSNVDTLTLNWNNGSDNETVSAGLTYNIMVGTTPGGYDIVSPLSDPQSGKRKVVEMGNVYQNKSWKIIGLPPGLYYWRVQAIDNNFEGSSFSNEQVAVVGEVVIECGDLDASGGGPDISDLVYFVDYVFNDGPAPVDLNSADLDGSGTVDISDLVYFVDYFFNDGTALNCP